MIMGIISVSSARWYSENDLVLVGALAVFVNCPGFKRVFLAIC